MASDVPSESVPVAVEDQATSPPRQSADPQRLLILPLALVLFAVWAVLQLRGLDEIPFHSKGEPREAIAVQDLVHSDRYILPLRNGYEMPRKPPLFYWLGGAAAAATGQVDEQSVRMPSAVQSGVAALLLLVVGVGAGTPLAGLFSALALLTSFEWMRAAVSARIDMTLALGTTASFAGLYLAVLRPRPVALFLLYGGMAWGTLAKGPIGIVLPTLCAIVVLLIDSGTRWVLPLGGIAALALIAHQLGAPTEAVAALAGVTFAVVFLYVAWTAVRPLRPFLGFACVGVLTALWYGMAARAGGEEFVRTQILAENFGRFFGTAQIDVGHRHGLGYLFGALAAGFLPWTLFLPGYAAHAVAIASGGRGAVRTLAAHSLVWIAVVFGFFSISDSKRSVYLLPLYPAATTLVGLWLADLWQRRSAPRWLYRLTSVLAIGVALLTGAIAVAFALELAGLPLRRAIVDPIVARAAANSVAAAISAGFDIWTLRLCTYAAATCAAALALLYCSLYRHARGTVAALLASVVALLLLVQHAIMPAVTPANDRADYAARLSAVAAARSLATTPSFDAAVAFHLGGALPVLESVSALPPGAIAIMTLDEWRRLTPARRDGLEVLPGLWAPKQNNQVALIAVQRTTVANADDIEN